MVTPKFLKFDTLSLHAGQQPDPATGARAVPIYQTTSYVFDDTDHAAALYNLERPGHIYTRLSNPTVAVMEERVAALEGGIGAVATASGMAAIFLAIATLMDKGGHIVSSGSLYGGTHNLFSYTLPRFGINTTFVNPRDPQAFRDAITDDTRLVFGETLGNPGIEVMDLPAIAEVAHEAGLPLMIDSTFTTPYLMKPFEHGADIIMHSLTKYIGGHGVAIGGIFVDSGRFDWQASGKFPTLTEPYDGYHGINFADEFGTQALVMRARAEGMKDFGACMSPANAFYILQGLETLPLRMQKHVSNAQTVAEFLEGQEAVEWVNYPGLAAHPDHDLAKHLIPKGPGAMLSFGLKGGRAAGRTFIESVKLASHLANVGDAKTLVIHPASTTHQQMNAEALNAAGIGEGMIRLSVGIEDVDDIVGDLKQAIRASQKA
ncbi:MAG: O-acetylhomoserine aminocarboxypropyltransferase [Rhodospirillaceae bacterium]|nr:O-acetylhomoserine aminocarboxypropyltransferase [Rhodospirillaceae bacterium]